MEKTTYNQNNNLFTKNNVMDIGSANRRHGSDERSMSGQTYFVQLLPFLEQDAIYNRFEPLMEVDGSQGMRLRSSRGMGLHRTLTNCFRGHRPHKKCNR